MTNIEPLGNQFLIYLHIQKTAGITIQRVLRRSLGPSVANRLFRKIRDKPTASLLEAMKQKTFADRYFVGHICFGVHRHLPQPFRYISFIRDPVKRLVSLYKYSLTNRSAYYHEHAIGKSAKEFLLETPLMELDNGMTRFLAGSENDLFINRTQIGECTKNLAEIAFANIERDFGLVGVTERFDESFVLMRQMLNRKPFYLSRNRSSNEGSQIRISDSVLQEIENKNWLDRIVYEWVCQRLESQIAESKMNENGDLATFRKYNDLYQNSFGRVYNSYALAKSVLTRRAFSPN